MATDITDRLAGLLEEPMSALGLDLEAVDLTKAGKHSVLRVAVDKDGRVDMDDIAEATREVSRILDESDAMGAAPYTLEVSSPGVDRPLTLPRHWRRNARRLVKITRPGGDPVTGRIMASDDESVLLDVEGAEVRLPYAEIGKAKVQIEFKAPAGGPETDADADAPDDDLTEE